MKRKTFDCPCCHLRGVTSNRSSYAFIRYRCRYCKAEWHNERAMREAWGTPYSEQTPININQFAFGFISLLK